MSLHSVPWRQHDVCSRLHLPACSRCEERIHTCSGDIRFDASWLQQHGVIHADQKSGESGSRKRLEPPPEIHDGCAHAKKESPFPPKRHVLEQGSTFMPCAGHPAVLRYWQESSQPADWLKPDQTSGVTVETTAYVLLTFLLKVTSLPVPCLTQVCIRFMKITTRYLLIVDWLFVDFKGRIQYANPVLTWLTQDHHYGGAFYSGQVPVKMPEDRAGLTDCSAPRLLCFWHPSSPL